MPRPVNALIVDDEPHVLVFLRGIVKQLGIQVVWEAASAAAALERAAQSKPDVVLLDLNLPEVDGLQVLAKLKAQNPHMPVIIVSAQSTMRTLDRASELGALGYVLKHSTKAELTDTLSAHFDTIARSSEARVANGGDPAGSPP